MVQMLDDQRLKELCETIETRFEEISKSEAKTEEQPPDILYHYTSAEGLLGIVTTRELWATNVLYQNDARELEEALELLTSELRAATLGLGEMAGFLSKGISVYARSLSIDHFVASFCEDGDLLSQWRAYASQHTGYSIGFYAGTLQSATIRQENNVRGACTLRKANYGLSQKTRMIKVRVAALPQILEPLAEELEPKVDSDYQQLALIWNQVAASFHPTLALMKHSAFQDEREWRLVRTLWKPPVSTISWPVEVRSIGGRLARIFEYRGFYRIHQSHQRCEASKRLGVAQPPMLSPGPRLYGISSICRSVGALLPSFPTFPCARDHDGLLRLVPRCNLDAEIDAPAARGKTDKGPQPIVERRRGHRPPWGAEIHQVA